MPKYIVSDPAQIKFSWPAELLTCDTAAHQPLESTYADISAKRVKGSDVPSLRSKSVDYERMRSVADFPGALNSVSVA